MVYAYVIAWTVYMHVFENPCGASYWQLALLAAVCGDKGAIARSQSLLQTPSDLPLWYVLLSRAASTSCKKTNHRLVGGVNMSEGHSLGKDAAYRYGYRAADLVILLSIMIP